MNQWKNWLWRTGNPAAEGTGYVFMKFLSRILFYFILHVLVCRDKTGITTLQLFHHYIWISLRWLPHKKKKKKRIWYSFVDCSILQNGDLLTLNQNKSCLRNNPIGVSYLIESLLPFTISFSTRGPSSNWGARSCLP